VRDLNKLTWASGLFPVFRINKQVLCNVQKLLFLVPICVNCWQGIPGYSAWILPVINEKSRKEIFILLFWEVLSQLGLKTLREREGRLRVYSLFTRRRKIFNIKYGCRAAYTIPFTFYYVQLRPTRLYFILEAGFFSNTTCSNKPFLSGTPNTFIMTQ